MSNLEALLLLHLEISSRLTAVQSGFMTSEPGSQGRGGTRLFSHGLPFPAIPWHVTVQRVTVFSVPRLCFLFSIPLSLCSICSHLYPCIFQYLIFVLHYSFCLSNSNCVCVSLCVLYCMCKCACTWRLLLFPSFLLSFLPSSLPPFFFIFRFLLILLCNLPHSLNCMPTVKWRLLSGLLYFLSPFFPWVPLMTPQLGRYPMRPGDLVSTSYNIMQVPVWPHSDFYMGSNPQTCTKSTFNYPPSL